ncbi:class I adenylate-forming enzyme family protein [Streptomyces sp. WAC06614]|uniref:class I adenylate-forming enzyme family protein n=1 Tax=Streptomyces sp. WAC06614 TaxID=2487416 RepID=UPI000F771D4A|nr:class I adenylate-forming enzyme family protein [Streptomyces sp. WAC06614]RSS83377.1 long-chain fatty acid--CoA ligase [Streptomyces sp. WAC06614]
MPVFPYPPLPLDGLLRRAARRDPDGVAVRHADGRPPVTFAELDEQADRVAAHLERELGRRGARIGVGNVLDASFAAAYYGTARSGNTAVLVNPLLKEAGLAHVCAAAAVELAFVPAATGRLLDALAGQLPALRRTVVTTGGGQEWQELLAGAPRPTAGAGQAAGAGAGGAGLDEVVCIQFTTGTTGRPRGVRLTHRNLVANAAQTAAAHELDRESVTLNHLPLYHVMHLNSAVFAGACQVLCTDPDPLASLAVAAREGVSHYYGLPARLHRLAAQLHDADEVSIEGVPAGPRLAAVLSGGTALDPGAARVLRRRLGVPVVQGYGMAELSPLSHCQRPGAAPAYDELGESDRPRSTAVGPAVPGTECRIVHLDTRRPLPPYTPGEVQVRGPQLMAGYLDCLGPSKVGYGGWFSTGDVGYVNGGGELFLVDRLGDVFKYDNELVSPTAVEAVVAADERVADCVVAGWPDPVHGAVVWTGIVLRDPVQPGLLDVVDSIVERANERLAPFEQIRRVEVLDAVPRTPVGKPARRGLAMSIRTRAAVETVPVPAPAATAAGAGTPPAAPVPVPVALPLPLPPPLSLPLPLAAVPGALPDPVPSTSGSSPW